MRKIVLGSLLALGGCFFSPSVEKDLNAVCDIAKNTESIADPEQRAGKMADRFSKELRTTEVKNLIQAIAGIDPTQRYPMVLHFAREEQKLPNWSCTELESLWPSEVPKE